MRWRSQSGHENTGRDCDGACDYERFQPFHAVSEKNYPIDYDRWGSMVVAAVTKEIRQPNDGQGLSTPIKDYYKWSAQ
jgi:hypothetical protein